MTKKLLMGNEAMAHAALEAGVSVVAGYPGTPSSEIVETVARQVRRGAARGVHVEWSTNEKAALELLFGASLAGARCLFTCKQVGLNVASDPLLSLNYVSVRGGLVLIVADDPGPISSQTEQDTRRFAAFAKVPVLDPATPEQAFEMVKAAFELSERFRTPVIVRPTTRVDHASTFFDVQEETEALPTPPEGFQHDPSKWVIFPRRAHQAHGEILARLAEMQDIFSNEDNYARFNPVEEGGDGSRMDGRDDAMTRRYSTTAPSYGILTSGVSAAYTREALAQLSERLRKASIPMPRYRLMQVGTPYPFPDQAIGQFCLGLSEVMVIEELDGVIEDGLANFIGRNQVPLNIQGRASGDVQAIGENSVEDIAERIERFLGLTGRLSLQRLRTGALASEEPELPVHLRKSAAAALPERPPVLCPGCPHRGSFYAVKQALGIQPAVLCGDIGCYTLGNAHPLDALDTCLCMGGGVTMAQGIAVADPTVKAVAYIGDSTFFASGETGLANAAYNGHDITVMVLDNTTTAMTGFQPHPGTGLTLMGAKNRPLSIHGALEANGFTQIFHANPFDRNASTRAVSQALAYEGPSAVIFEGACSQLTLPEMPVTINEEICTGCKRCITAIGCPAIAYNPQKFGPRSGDRGQAVIDIALCTGCGLCTQVCPFHAIHSDSDLYRKNAADRAQAVAAAVDFATEQAEAAFDQQLSPIGDHAVGKPLQTDKPGVVRGARSAEGEDREEREDHEDSEEREDHEEIIHTQEYSENSIITEEAAELNEEPLALEDTKPETAFPADELFPVEDIAPAVVTKPEKDTKPPSLRGKYATHPAGGTSRNNAGAQSRPRHAAPGQGLGHEDPAQSAPGQEDING